MLDAAAEKAAVAAAAVTVASLEDAPYPSHQSQAIPLDPSEVKPDPTAESDMLSDLALLQSLAMVSAEEANVHVRRIVDRQPVSPGCTCCRCLFAVAVVISRL